MTVRTESRITIASGVPEVWAYVCDVGRWPEWAPTVRECWLGGGAPLQPGSRVEQRAKGIFGSRLYPVPGYPQGTQRLRAVQALGLRPGDSVVEIACGTGLNFSLIEQVIGP